METNKTPFNNDLFPDVYDGVIFASDDEPDDAVAKYILIAALKKYAAFHRLQKLPSMLFITGEGKESKVGLVSDQVEALGLVGVTIVQGQLSKRTYPKEMHAAFLLGRHHVQPNESNADPNNAISTLFRFLEAHQNPLFVMLKPCWELFEMPALLLAKTTVAAYGSFNFRCLMEKSDKATLAAFFNTSFKRFVLYETFHAIGEDNSINSNNAQRFYELIRQKADAGDRFWQGVRLSIQIWNNHIAMSQLKSMQNEAKVMEDTWEQEKLQLEAAANLSRTQTPEDAQTRQEVENATWKKRKANVDKMLQGAKIVNSIIVAKGQQMVFADFGLTTLMLAASRDALKEGSIVQCNISFDEGRGNTMISPNAAGKVFCIRDVDRARLVAALERAIE